MQLGHGLVGFLKETGSDHVQQVLGQARKPWHGDQPRGELVAQMLLHVTVDLLQQRIRCERVRVGTGRETQLIRWVENNLGQTAETRFLVMPGHASVRR